MCCSRLGESLTDPRFRPKGSPYVGQRRAEVAGCHGAAATGTWLDSPCWMPRALGMKVLLVHNEYGKFSGEEAAFYGLVNLLRQHGHEVQAFVRRTAELSPGLAGKVYAFTSGIWSFQVAGQFEDAIRSFRPDIVHIQNLFPLISPSVVSVSARHGIPLVMGCHNYRLFCPTGLMLRNGEVCSKCAVGSAFNCIRYNCEGWVPKSVGYAVRHTVANPLLLRHVDRFIVLSHFQRDRFVEWGVDHDRICVIPNFLPRPSDESTPPPASAGDYVAFLGRLSPEKGIPDLLAAAKACPGIPFRIAGHAATMPDALRDPPSNVKFVGELPREEVAGFLRGARFLVVPSVWYEAFGIVAIEAMAQGRPVIASRIGALSDVVDDGVNGYLVEPRKPEALATKIGDLWADPERVDSLGLAARHKAIHEYDSETAYRRFMDCYGGVDSGHRNVTVGELSS